jgi:formylglycine-generating enzyme required for sulfatase activity
MPKPPDAFLSYTRFDDRRERGKISQFRQELADEVQAVTAEPFDIFQDVDGIGLGEHWPGKLDEMLDQARFFVPILTPLYFKSKPCRGELEKFAQLERKAGRDDLILPIYWRTCPVLEDKELRTADPLATLIDGRHRWDWRDLRHHSFRTRKVKLELEALAKRIDDAHRRVAAGPQPHSASEQAVETRVTSPRFDDSLTLPDFAKASGSVFRDIDASWCPEMVVIPPGEFMMGSTEAERQWAVAQGTDPKWVNWEKPQHRVRVGCPLALGRYPVTFEEFDRFCEQMGRERPKDEGWGRGRRPAINVSWNDAKAYADWLAAETRQPYRLLSEAEWEYACGGDTNRLWWTKGITPESANFAQSRRRTTEVGSYPASPFSLHDILGNVWEWCEDCWNENYERAPADGSAWTSGDCSLRVIRGGSWKSQHGLLRPSYRNRDKSTHSENNIGFRVARTL